MKKALSGPVRSQEDLLRLAGITLGDDEALIAFARIHGAIYWKSVAVLMLAILILPLMILGWTAASVVIPSAVASMANPGPHGFSEVLYAYTSQTANNGSAFGGLTGNTLWYNTTGGISMLVGRFLMIIPAMAIAGALAAKKIVPPSSGTFPTTGGLFVGLTVGVIVIVGGLTFFPALALGPIVEHLAMQAGSLF